MTNCESAINSCHSQNNVDSKSIISGDNTGGKNSDGVLSLRNKLGKNLGRFMIDKSSVGKSLCQWECTREFSLIIIKWKQPGYFCYFRQKKNSKFKNLQYMSVGRVANDLFIETGLLFLLKQIFFSQTTKLLCSIKILH